MATDRIHGTADAVRRLRQLRNLNEASQFELRVQNMPKLIAEVEEFMRSGSLDALPTFNQNQVADEHGKQEFLAEHPELEPAVERLEDQSILRGTLAAFDLDAATVAARAAAFEAAFAPEHWPALTGALLAVGEYQRDFAGSDYHRFGSPTTESVWRAVLVDRGDRTSLARTRAVLASFLDTVAASPDPVGAQLKAVVDKFVADRVAGAEDHSTCGDGADRALGYELTMLRKSLQRSWYRDPYLYAIWRVKHQLAGQVKPHPAQDRSCSLSHPLLPSDSCCLGGSSAGTNNLCGAVGADGAETTRGESAIRRRGLLITSHPAPPSADALAG